MDEIILVQADPRVSATFFGALEPPFKVTRAHCWKELSELFGRPQALACVVDVFEAPFAIPLVRLKSLRRSHPGVAVVVASDFKGRELDLYRLGRLSVDGIIPLNHLPGPREIRSLVDGATAVALANIVTERVGRDLSPLAREALRWTIEHAEARPQVSDLAVALALTPRALLREMDAADVVPPRTLLLWGRLIRASHLLTRPHETVEAIAFRLGYATSGALRKALKRHVGCNPTALLRRGGLSWTLDAFQRTGLRRRRKKKDRWVSARSHRWRIPSNTSGNR